MANFHIRNRNLDQPCLRALRTALGAGRTVYIVGKGPSIDDLKGVDFAGRPGAPIICINESIHAIERLDVDPARLFCLQYDRLRQRNRPGRATWLLSDYAYDAQNGGAAGAIRYSLDAIAPSKPNLTASTALSMAALAGANRAIMLGFDAAFSGDCTYAPSIGYGSGLSRQSPTRFVRFDTVGIPARAAEEGVRLTWQAPKDFWFIALVLRSGGQYDMRHVASVAQQIGQNLKSPHGVLLLTDFPGTAPVWRQVRLSEDWPGWFSKVELFRPDIGLRGGVLYTDLDNYFGRPFRLPRWDAMKPGILYAPRDPCRDLWMSALMAWRLGEIAKPYELFRDRPVTRHPTITCFGDEEIINEALSGQIEPLPWLTSGSWKVHRPRPDGVDCVVFHGRPKPWDVGLAPGLEPSPPRPPDGPSAAGRMHNPRAAACRFLQTHTQFTKKAKP